MKNAPILAIILLLVAISLLPQLSACNRQPSGAMIETVVAGTVAAVQEQGPQEATTIVEITQVKEITEVVVIEITSTPKPTEKATATLEATPIPEKTPTPPSLLGKGYMTETPTPMLTIEPSGKLHLGFGQFVAHYKSMTDLQKDNYATELPGKLITWTGRVDNVTSDGIVILDNPFSSGTAFLIGVPTETAIELDQKMLVDFTGMIQSFSGNISPKITVVDVKVLRSYLPPTATPRR